MASLLLCLSVASSPRLCAILLCALLCLLIAPLPAPLSTVALVSAQASPGQSSSPRDRLAALHRQREVQKKIKQQERSEFVQRQQEEQDRIHRGRDRERDTQRDDSQQLQQRQHEQGEQDRGTQEAFASSLEPQPPPLPSLLDVEVAASTEGGLDAHSIANVSSAAHTDNNTQHSQQSTESASDDTQLQQPPQAQSDGADDWQVQRLSNDTAQSADEREADGTIPDVREADWQGAGVEDSDLQQQRTSSNDSVSQALLDETEPRPSHTRDTQDTQEEQPTAADRSRDEVESQIERGQSEDTAPTVGQGADAAASDSGDGSAESEQQQLLLAGAEEVNATDGHLLQSQEQQQHQDGQHEQQARRIVTFNQSEVDTLQLTAATQTASEGRGSHGAERLDERVAEQAEQQRQQEEEEEAHMATASTTDWPIQRVTQTPPLASPLLQSVQSSEASVPSASTSVPSLSPRPSFSVSSVVRSLIDRLASSAQSLTSSIGRISLHTHKLHSHHTQQQERTDSASRRKRAVQTDEQQTTQQQEWRTEEEVQRSPFSAARAEQRAYSKFQTAQQQRDGTVHAAAQQRHDETAEKQTEATHTQLSSHSSSAKHANTTGS